MRAGMQNQWGGNSLCLLPLPLQQPKGHNDAQKLLNLLAVQPNQAGRGNNSRTLIFLSTAENLVCRGMVDFRLS